MTNELILFDTETADFKGGVCDLAIVVVNENLEVIWEAESLIDPQRPISPSAQGIHHISDDMVCDAPTLAEFFELYGNPFLRPRPIYGGHNVQFDIRVMGAENLADEFRSACTLKLAKNLYPDLENHKLQTLRYHFRLDAGTAHRAMGDVRVCLSFIRMVANLNSCGLSGVLELCRKPLSLDNKMAFGKHKGEKLRDLPKSYVRWLLDNATELDPDLREALETRVPA
jgi:exodeoxyribonuclease X